MSKHYDLTTIYVFHLQFYCTSLNVFGAIDRLIITDETLSKSSLLL